VDIGDIKMADAMARDVTTDGAPVPGFLSLDFRTVLCKWISTISNMLVDNANVLARALAFLHALKSFGFYNFYVNILPCCDSVFLLVGRCKQL
jgi:hypothetical protein